MAGHETYQRRGLSSALGNSAPDGPFFIFNHQRRRIRGDKTLKGRNTANTINNANRCLPSRYIQSNIMFHHCLSVWVKRKRHNVASPFVSLICQAVRVIAVEIFCRS